MQKLLLVINTKANKNSYGVAAQLTPGAHAGVKKDNEQNLSNESLFLQFLRTPKLRKFIISTSF